MAGGDGKAFIAQTFDQLATSSFSRSVKSATCKAGTHLFHKHCKFLNQARFLLSRQEKMTSKYA